MKQTVEIDVPDNMELVDVKPTFKKKKITFEEIIEKFKTYSWSMLSKRSVYDDVNNRWINKHCTYFYLNERHMDKMEAINKLLIVAKYLNGDWIPNWEDEEKKYYIHMDTNEIAISSFRMFNLSICYFKTKELASQAIEILGEDTIRLALGDY